MTRNGVEYNLSQSPYYADVGVLRYYFSSRRHLDKFTSGLEREIKRNNDILLGRYGIMIESDELGAIRYYRMCETRGELITLRGSIVPLSKLSLVVDYGP